MKQYKIFLAGFSTAVCVALMLGNLYGEYRQKLGTLWGQKKGEIEVAQFLEKYFPAAKDESDISGPTLYVKWYTITVIKNNDVATLKVKRMM